MAWTFAHADLTAELERAQRYFAESGPQMMYAQRLGRAYVWLDQPDTARPFFAAGAETFKDGVASGRRDDASGWTEYGLLLRHAGEREDAQAAFRHALTLLNRFEAWLGDELRYLLGEPLQDDDGYVAQLARGERASTRAEIVADVREQEVLPSYTAPDLTLYDLLEDTFDEPRPPHLEMLRATGLLREG